jgi:hypothetical protein
VVKVVVAVDVTVVVESVSKIETIKRKRFFFTIHLLEHPFQQAHLCVN